MTSSYSFFSSRFLLPREEVTRRQAKEAFEEFVAGIPTRLQELDHLLTELGGQGLELSRSGHANALCILEPLFGVSEDDPETRQRQIDSLPPKFREFLAMWIPRHDINGFTFSLCFDLGIAFAEIMRSEHSFLSWDLSHQRKGYVDYQKPVILSTANRMELEPVSIMKNLVRRSLRSQRDVYASSLWLFEIWTEFLGGDTAQGSLKGAARERAFYVKHNRKGHSQIPK